MTTKTLMLGDIDIGEYVIKNKTPTRNLEVIKSELNQLNEYKNNLEKLKANAYSCEREIYKERTSKWEKAYDNTISELISLKYPLIDLSFLNKSNSKEILSKGKKVTINVPAFCAYRLNDKELTTKIEFGIPEREKYETRSLGGKYPLFNTYQAYVGTFRHPDEQYKYIKSPKEEKINSKLESELLKAFKYSKFENFPKQIFQNQNSISFESTFNGLIPLEVKQKINESLKYFKQEDLYLIGEIKPEEWNAKTIISSDPLLIGMWHEKDAHLIAHFKTTSLKDLIKHS